MNARFRSLLLTAAAALAAPIAGAQQPSLPHTSAMPTAAAAAPAPAPDHAARQTPAGPTRDAARVAVQSRRSDVATDAAALQQGGGFGQSEALMIVGGAAFVAGLIIGGDAGTIVMLGGAGIGLYGLYLYLQ